MFSVLDGLPLAIAQAGAFLQQSKVGVGTYLEFYEQQWEELMKSQDLADAPLQDYPDRSVTMQSSKRMRLRLTCSFSGHSLTTKIYGTDF